MPQQLMQQKRGKPLSHPLACAKDEGTSAPPWQMKYSGGSFWLALSTDQVRHTQRQASNPSKSTTASASRHKKTRCDTHIGPGDGGNINMA
jgi:hypothetical protein